MGAGLFWRPNLVLTCRHVVDDSNDEQFLGVTADKDVTVEGNSVSRIFRSPEGPEAGFSDGPDLLHWRNHQNKLRLIDRLLEDAAQAANAQAVVTFLVRTGQTFGWIQPASLRPDETPVCALKLRSMHSSDS